MFLMTERRSRIKMDVCWRIGLIERRSGSATDVCPMFLMTERRSRIKTDVCWGIGLTEWRSRIKTDVCSGPRFDRVEGLKRMFVRCF
jgi:hypothetical protein